MRNIRTMAKEQPARFRPFPTRSLEKALVIVQAIVDKGAGRSMDRLLVADAIGRTPSSSEFKVLLSASRSYGLTSGTEKADFIVPTELGLKIAQPQSDVERVKALVVSCLTPDLMGRVLRQFNRNKLPEPAFLRNTLERTFGVDRGHSEELATLLLENARFCGILQNISGSQYLRIDEPVAQGTQAIKEEQPEVDNEEPAIQAEFGSFAGPAIPFAPPKPAASVPKPGKIFVAHGKNRKPMESLKKVLDQFKIPFTIAVDAPHEGRPISKKVADLMRDCSAAIFVFTKDERFVREDEKGNKEEVWRPSENVVYELGAASILWERRIIILREEGVNFPTDFKDLGYITFSGNDVANQALDLLKELVALGLVRVQAAE